MDDDELGQPDDLDPEDALDPDRAADDDEDDEEPSSTRASARTSSPISRTSWTCGRCSSRKACAAS